MFKFIDELNNVLVFILIEAGLWFIFGENIVNLLKRIWRIRDYEVGIEENHLIFKMTFFRDLRTLLSVVYNLDLKESSNMSIAFLLLSMGLFLFSGYIFLKRLRSLALIVLISLLVAMIPYIYLRIRLRKIRYESSYEAEALLCLLSNNYKKCGLNMIAAIDETTANGNKNLRTNAALFRLSLGVKEAGSSMELEGYINQFIYSIDTDWAQLLGMNIYMAIDKGTDVRASLDEIIDLLKRARKTLEEEKRYNREAMQMIKYLTPVMYILSIFILIKLFGFTIRKYINYQLFSPLGFKFFIACIGSVAANFAIAGILNRPKYDL